MAETPVLRTSKAPNRSGSCRSVADATRKYFFEVFNGGERVIKVMKKGPPTLIFRRLAKPNRVIFESVPLDEKHVLIWIFDASLQLMRNISVHRRNYGLRLGE